MFWVRAPPIRCPGLTVGLKARGHFAMNWLHTMTNHSLLSPPEHVPWLESVRLPWREPCCPSTPGSSSPSTPVSDGRQQRQLPPPPPSPGSGAGTQVSPAAWDQLRRVAGENWHVRQQDGRLPGSL
ncbi:hypothetical protein PoB_006376200 [Plakobranchus ocellatus]|uniref:Uncharacterized protein n=1 Tax=Plakobranchus ocellatus TaxID=259542 RepID=A0AAV4CZC4_9GAST|nr:hypothetical protein PoB_006376200 [Plakobranchus ocellatus]